MKAYHSCYKGSTSSEASSLLERCGFVLSSLPLAVRAEEQLKGLQVGGPGQDPELERSFLKNGKVFWLPGFKQALA